MDGKISPLYSDYIIDGVPQELTPAQMLDVCLAERLPVCYEGSFEQIVDESIDPFIRPCVTSPSRVREYLASVQAQIDKPIEGDIPFVDFYSRQQVALALIDAIWRRGHFSLQQLTLQADWRWDSIPMGRLSAFYASVMAASDYIDALGVRLLGYGYTEVSGTQTLEVAPHLLENEGVESFSDDEMFEQEIEYGVEHPTLGSGRIVSSSLAPDLSSWVVYIPFDDGQYRLGGSVLSRVLGVSGEVTPQIEDADYLIDCYEVVREMVEDGILLSGVTVGRGGLMTAMKTLSSPGLGIDAELGALAEATGERDIVRLLFSEVPGVLVQIADSDYDYMDAEMLLQDVAFYPLGHPVPGGAVTAHISDRSPIQNILESIIRSQSSEGED